MENKDKLKEIDIKNRTCWYFGELIKDVDIYFSDILLDEELYENISVYDVSYKTLTVPKPLRITFDKIDGFIRVHGDEFIYLIMDVKKVVLQIVLIIILERSELIYIILYLLKKY